VEVTAREAPNGGGGATVWRRLHALFSGDGVAMALSSFPQR
jgi:hypothetical protein